MDGFVKQSITAEAKLVQMHQPSTATEASAALPRNKYVEIHTEKHEPEAARLAGIQTKHTAEAIVTQQRAGRASSAGREPRRWLL